MNNSSPSNRLGRNGVDEIKAHPWFQGVDWDTLRMQPVPYVPRGAQLIQNYLSQLRNQDPASAVSRELIQQITANFDTFAEDDTQWKGGLGGISVKIPDDQDLAGQEFIGYTFKRKKDIVRSTLGLHKIFEKMQ